MILAKIGQENLTIIRQKDCVFLKFIQTPFQESSHYEKRVSKNISTVANQEI